MTHHLLRALVLLTAAAFASAASAADTVRVGKAVPFAWTFTPIDVGIETGLFAKQGLELTVTGFAGDARVQQALVSDSIDFGLGSGAGMGFLAKGVPAKAVAAMAGAPMNMSLVVSYDSPIKSLDQIKGKKIGITTVGSLTDWLLKRVVADRKWAPNDVTAVTVGGMDSTKAALKTGQIDGVVIALELGYALEAAKEWRVVSLLAPFAPYIAEELWEEQGRTGPVFKQAWPVADAGLAREDEAEVVIQVNGKVRGRISVAFGMSREMLQQSALGDSKIKALLDGKQVMKVIVVPDKLVNIVVK